MDIWSFIVMLGSPAKPSKLEIGIKRAFVVADRIMSPIYERKNALDAFKDAERSIRHD